jgi:tRNA threonylcarbamoyladenosine biosynthesis protein TsaE
MGLTDPALVTSPTYVLIQEYRARLPIFHFDAYRLRCVVEFLDLGIEEYYAAQGVCLVEWADRVPGALPEQHLQIQLEVTGPDSRRATLTAFGSPYETLLEKVSGQPKGGGTADNWAASSYSV